MAPDRPAPAIPTVDGQRAPGRSDHEPRRGTRPGVAWWRRRRRRAADRDWSWTLRPTSRHCRRSYRFASSLASSTAAHGSGGQAALQWRAEPRRDPHRTYPCGQALGRVVNSFAYLATHVFEQLMDNLAVRSLGPAT